MVTKITYHVVTKITYNVVTKSGADQRLIEEKKITNIKQLRPQTNDFKIKYLKLSKK